LQITIKIDKIFCVRKTKIESGHIPTIVEVAGKATKERYGTGTSYPDT
jgi:hypothetical protein